MQETKSEHGIIRKAVIPAAGFGTRMLPITKSLPKEMLPVGNKPMIQHVLEEAVAAGVKQIGIVIREGKEVIRDYFSPRSPATGSEELNRLLAGCELSFIYQRRPLGLGDALLEAAGFVGNHPFLMMVPDQLMLSEVPASLQLIRHWKPEYHILSSLLRLPKEDVPFFAGARGVDVNETASGEELVINRLQTEEETRAYYRDATYELRGFGRTIYQPEIFKYLGPDFINPRTGEVDLWKTFAACADKLSPRGVVLEGDPVDLGTLKGYYHYLPHFGESNV